MKQYKLGETVWYYNKIQGLYSSQDTNFNGRLGLEDLIKMGAVPIESEFEFEEIPEVGDNSAMFGIAGAIVNSLIRNQNKIIKLLTEKHG